MNFPKSPPVLASSRHRFSFPVFLFALMCLHAGVALDASAAGYVIKITEGRLISADVVDFPLTRVLRDLSQTLPIEIKGRPDGNDRLTLHFSHLTLQDALRRIMAGYNYVVIEPGPEGGRLVITILGKATRTVRELAPPPSPVAATPAAANIPEEPSPQAVPAQPPQRRPVPPPPPNEGQPSPTAAANPAPGGDTGAPTPGTVTTTIPAITAPTPEATAAPPTPDATATSPGSQSTATPPGVLPAPSDQPEFNPAAWGGRGRHK